jgi:hypothetical protein
MNEYLTTLAYIALCCIGSSIHYIKKRYYDHTTTDSLYKYLGDDITSTYKTFLTILSISITAASTHTTGFYFSPLELYTILVSGYTADSILNKSSDA